MSQRRECPLRSWPQPCSPDGAGFGVPAALHWEELIDDQYPPDPYAPGPRPSLFVAGSSLNSGSGQDWQIIRYVEMEGPP